ncbi:MAG: DUF1294 domain-containing protein [Chloroflexota bacterium]|nr:DUF1294 domain-containing protein [Chloroflexota bacterium]
MNGVLGVFAYFIYFPVILIACSYLTQWIFGLIEVSWLAAWLLAITTVSFLMNGYDKLMSKVLTGLHLTFLPLRVPEAYLIWLLTFPGGTIGTVFGMLIFNHKTGPDSLEYRMRLILALGLQFLVVVLIVAYLIAFGDQAIVFLEGLVERLTGFVVAVTDGVIDFIF